MVKRIEALADGIIAYNGGLDPQHRFYKLRNPGGLRAFYPYQWQDSEGYRRYRSWGHGYQALIQDLTFKCKGETKSGLTTESPLLELNRVMGLKDESLRYILKFIRLATDSEVSEETPISFFVEDF